MIAVIADDLTGAAEIAGIGLRYNLLVEISSDVNASSDAEILIIATDTRSKRQDEAVSEMAQISREIKKLNPEILFKKVDSVLRGHIIAEIKAQIEALGLNRALIAPANPVMGRTIANGMYFVHKVPISDTGFSKDPEFPMKDSDILKMLRVEDGTVKVQKVTQKLPYQGIVVGEVEQIEDLRCWVELADKKTLLAGGSGLFLALLDSIKITPVELTCDAIKLKTPQLFVSGTAFNKNAELVKDVYCKGGPVSYMPEAIRCFQDPSEEDLDAWAVEIKQLINEHSKAIIAVDPDSKYGRDANALQLRERMASIVKKVCDEVEVVETIIEGGSTASAVLRNLGYRTLIPVTEIAAGVIRSRVGENTDKYVTLKPGSYEWPEDIWHF